MQFRGVSLWVGTSSSFPFLKYISVLILENLLGPGSLNAQFMKYAVKIFLCLLAPAQISVPVDVKSEAGTGKM